MNGSASSVLRDRLKAGATLFNGWLAIPDGFCAEVMASALWDSLTVDLQHGIHDYGSMVRCLQGAAVHGVPTLVRVSHNEAAECGRALDAGAAGLICPLVNSAAEARRIVRACRYPPAGKRSNGPTRAALGTPPGHYQQRANDEVLCFAMIETADALAAVSEIAAVPGLDGLYVGPTDLALSLGLPPRLDTDEPRILEALQTILTAAGERGLVAGVHTGSAAYARRMAAAGFGFVTAGTDAAYLAAGASDTLETVRG